MTDYVKRHEAMAGRLPSLYPLLLTREEAEALRQICEGEGINFRDPLAVKAFVLDQIGIPAGGTYEG